MPLIKLKTSKDELLRFMVRQNVRKIDAYLEMFE